MSKFTYNLPSPFNQIHDLIFNAHHIQHYELLTYVFSAAIFHGKTFHKSRISNNFPSVRHFYFEAINEGNKMKRINMAKKNSKLMLDLRYYFRSYDLN
jgi:hypothetical protein